MADFMESWERRRKTYKKLPRIVRVLLTGLAFILAPAGVIAMFTPLAVFEVGSILIFTSLTILSFEFDWAYDLLSWLRKKLADKKLRRKLAVFMVLVVSTYVVLAILWFWKR